MANFQTPRSISLPVRQALLRIIVISSLSSFLINVIFGAQLVQNDPFTGILLMGLSAIPLSVALHHILRLWPRQRWTVRLDFMYSTIEFIAVTGYVVAEIWLITRTLVMSIMMYIFALVFLWLSVGASFAFMVWNLRVTQYRTLGRAYDFIENTPLSNGRRDARLGRWSLLLGVNTFKRRFAVDRMFLRVLRAIIAIICLLATITLGYLVLVIQPIQQQLYLQTRQSGNPGGPKNVTLQVGLFLDFGTTMTPDGPKLLPSRDSFDLNITWQPESQYVPCDVTPLLASCNVSSPLSDSSPDTLTITVNYARALQQVPASSLKTGVYLCFNPEPRDIFCNAIALPTQLYPGFHVFGTTFYSFRETYAASRDLAFGIPHYDRHLVANIQALVPDPEYTTSNSDNTTSTLKLTFRGGLTTQVGYKIEREQSTNSVLSGFALLGGAWTFINGLFAAVFGCTLLLVLFGIKPLSIYGLVHLFQRRRSLVDSGYTLSIEEQSRTMAVLREHLLDDNDNDDMEAGEASEDKNQDWERSKLEGVAS